MSSGRASMAARGTAQSDAGDGIGYPKGRGRGASYGPTPAVICILFTVISTLLEELYLARVSSFRGARALLRHAAGATASSAMPFTSRQVSGWATLITAGITAQVRRYRVPWCHAWFGKDWPATLGAFARPPSTVLVDTAVRCQRWHASSRGQKRFHKPHCIKQFMYLSLVTHWTRTNITHTFLGSFLT